MRDKKKKIIFSCLFIVLILISIYIYQFNKDSYNFLSQNNKPYNLKINYNDINKDIKALINKSLNDESNTFSNPKVIFNPYKKSSSTAFLVFKTKKKTPMKLYINDKFMTTIKKATEHIIPLNGLINNYDNKILLIDNKDNKSELTLLKNTTNNENQVKLLANDKEKYRINIDLLWSGIERRTKDDKAKCDVEISSDKNIYSYSYEIIVDKKTIDSKEVKLPSVKKKVNFQLNNFKPGNVTVIVKTKVCVEDEYAENTAKTSVYIRGKLEKPPVVYRPKLKVNLNGGKTVQYFEISYEPKTVIKLTPPTQQGCIFAGWKLEKGDSKLSKDTLTIGTQDTEISAKWKFLLPTESYKCKNKSVGNAPYAYEYTGNCQVTSEGNDNWEIKFLTSGKFTIGHSINVDVFLVGGGGGGHDGHYVCTAYHYWNSRFCSKGYMSYGSSGTPGAFEIVKKRNLLSKNDGYEILVGNGGQESTAFGYSADGASGKNSINKFGEKDSKEVYCQRGTEPTANTGNSGYGGGWKRPGAGSSGIVIIRNAREK